MKANGIVASTIILFQFSISIWGARVLRNSPAVGSGPNATPLLYAFLHYRKEGFFFLFIKGTIDYHAELSYSSHFTQHKTHQRKQALS